LPFQGRGEENSQNKLPLQ